MSNSIRFSLVDRLPNVITPGMVYFSPDMSSGFIKIGRTDVSVYTIYDQENVFRKASDSTLGMVKASASYLADYFTQEVAVNPADGRMFVDPGDLHSLGPTTVIDALSTDLQVPTAKAVYDLLTTSISIQNGASTVEAPEVITDSSSANPVIDYLYGNKVYIWEQPLETLTLEAVEDSVYETTLYFSTASNFSISFPQGMKTMTLMHITGNNHYVLSIKNLVVAVETIDSYESGQQFIFSSEQLQSGVLEIPAVIETAGANPVIDNTLPNAIYKFGTVESLTMHNVPSNSLETVVYFTAGSTAVHLSLDSSIGLKITSGSSLYLRNGSFIIAIKDGVMTISDIVNI